MMLPDHEDRCSALRDFQANLVVTAGAGTGKTSLLVGRLLSALLRQHYEPGQILALTFTENAANEMHERLVRMLRTLEPYLAGATIPASDRYILEQLKLGPENLGRARELLERIDDLQISTFHSFCMRFLQEHARRLGLPPDLGVGEGREAAQVVDEVFLEHLRSLDEGEHPALERFSLGELRGLLHGFVDLPDDSFDHTRATLSPEELGAERAELQELRQRFAAARPAWQDCAADLELCYQALIEGRDLPTSPWLEPKKGTPTGGKKELGEDDAELAKQGLHLCRQRLLAYAEAADAELDCALEFIRPILHEARRRSAERGELAFQDLLLLTRQFLIDDPELRQLAGERLAAILVDEFQDTDPLQYDVIFLLAAAADQELHGDPMRLRLRPGCLFIVGDAKQSIYRFRRADVAAFARVVQSVAEQGGRRLELSANFRSCPPILDLVNRVCAASLQSQPPYQFGYAPVQAMLESAGAPPVELLSLAGEESLKAPERRAQEGLLITQRIQELRAEGVPLAEMAVLLRAATDTAWLMRPLRQAGIPYVLEGSRRFYLRQEVLLCTALIGVMARPHDPVAMLAILRSGLSAASDAAIHAWVEQGNSLDFRRLPADAEGPVAACLRWAAQRHTELQGHGTCAQLQLLLGLPELRLSEAVGFEGPQRIANIQRLLQVLLEDPPESLQAAASRLQTHNLKETEDEESALFDKGVDALRILTVHKSKGLEFGTVFVPDLARRSGAPPNRDPVKAERLYDAAGREVVTLKVGSAQNLHALRMKDANRLHAEAEARRLFYVAATRAQQRLILVVDETPQEKDQARLWQDDLDAVQHAGTTTRVERPRPELGGPAEAADPGPALAAFRAHAAAAASLELPTEPEPPSRLEEHGPALLGAADLARREHATALGTALHQYLSLVDLTRDAPDQELLEEMGADPELGDLVAHYHGSALPQRLAGAKALHREVPLSYLDAHEQVRNGVIDLLVEEGGGRWTVIDWKTDRIQSSQAAARAEQYRAQVEAYAAGAQRALGLDARPGCALAFIRIGTLLPLS